MKVDFDGAVAIRAEYRSRVRLAQRDASHVGVETMKKFVTALERQRFCAGSQPLLGLADCFDHGVRITEYIAQSTETDVIWLHPARCCSFHYCEGIVEPARTRELFLLSLDRG